MKGMRDLVYECMLPEERGSVDDFGLWAFGNEFLDLIDSAEFMKEWNKLHGEDLYIYPTGIIDEDISEMVSLWRHEKEN